MGVSLNGGTPISHPKMMIFSRKTYFLVGTTIFENPDGTGIFTYIYLHVSHVSDWGVTLGPRGVDRSDSTVIDTTKNQALLDLLTPPASPVESWRRVAKRLEMVETWCNGGM